MRRQYDLTVDGISQFCHEFLSREAWYIDKLSLQIDSATPQVSGELGEQEGKVLLRFKVKDCNLTTIEVDPEKERNILSFRCRIQLPTPYCLDSDGEQAKISVELLRALNQTNYLMEPAYFVVSDDIGALTLHLFYAIPANDAPFGYELLRRIMQETLLWVIGIAPELEKVACGKLSEDDFGTWLSESGNHLLRGSIEERLRWWIDHQKGD